MTASLVAEVILDVLSLIQAGFDLKVLAGDVKKMEADGASEKEIHDYVKALRDKELAELKALLEKGKA